jgi:sulfur carrier protein ThiS
MNTSCLPKYSQIDHRNSIKFLNQMPDIRLQLYSILREKLPPDAQGRVVIQLEEAITLGDLLAEFDITRRVVISVNGEHETDHKRELHDGDEVKIFSSISGGINT